MSRDVVCNVCGYSGPTWAHKCRAQRFVEALEKTADLPVSVMASSEMPAPSPHPEMPEHDDPVFPWTCPESRDYVEIPLSAIRALLATQGLAIVPAAEVTTPGERYMGNL
jgi:hypothetical protein